MQTAFISDRQITYDGRQLAPHWIFLQFGLEGHAAVAFIGPCRVELSEMVDMEDVKKKAPIYSPLMLHIIAELIDVDLLQGVYRQRLLIMKAKELLETMTDQRITRDGDDLYLVRTKDSRYKLSVSIATDSGFRTLIHTGFNIETEGTPVPTVGLTELGISDIQDFAEKLLTSYADEMADIWLARCKARSV